MAISSNTLFHFTKKFDTLIQILKSGGFWARYCKEYEWGRKKDIDFAVPIACFCDIPLSQIKEHISFYGNYGIGMSKDWAITNRHISPVFYLTEKSLVNKVINNLRRYSLTKKELPKTVEEANYRFFSIIKKYEGKTENKRNKKCFKTFYDEKEWRYIPEIPYKDSFIRLDKHQDIDLCAKSEATKDYLAEFKLKDINYIIVAEEDDRMKLLEEIDRIYKDKETAEACALLKSKILTCTQIEEDF